MSLPRAALYLRVSTNRQAEHDVSIPDQRRQGEAYCRARGYELIETYVEPGASGTNDRRPEFQRMMDAGTIRPRTFDVVVVHSFSRFFRDHFELEFYVRRLAKNGVKLISMTQELGDDPMHAMMRQIMALFDEYQSKEISKHTLRAMKENARQGFWNGAAPPIGYRLVEAEKRGAKIKKKLEVDPLTADVVRLIYKLALDGDGASGPMGIKAIATHLNDRQVPTRGRGRWGTGQVHRLLTRSTYVGLHEFNRRGHSKQKKPDSEVVPIDVPPLIDNATFEAVQAQLKARSPALVPARVVSGPTLLSGICFCADCGGAMTIRTGKGGRYRYYTCSTKARQGPTGCKGRSIPMPVLDELVIEHLEKRLLEPARLEEILSLLLGNRRQRREQRGRQVADIRRKAAEADARIKRLYEAIETGVASLDDPSLKDRIVELKAIRERALEEAERAEAADERPKEAVTPATLKAFSDAARRRMRTPSGAFRRDHLRALAQRVEVADSEVRIMGSRVGLLRALTVAQGGQMAAPTVPTFVPKWRPGRDSNPRPSL